MLAGNLKMTSVKPTLALAPLPPRLYAVITKTPYLSDVILDKMIFVQTLRSAFNNTKDRRSVKAGSATDVFVKGASHFHLHHSGQFNSVHCAISAL